jgi:uridylate kinase
MGKKARQAPKYKRILLKLSGEALNGQGTMGIDPAVLQRIASEVRQLVDLGVQVGLVVGGGNLFRGAALSKAGLGRVTGDHMGMLATLMNSLAMRDVFEENNIPTRIMSAITMTGIVDPYDRRKAVDNLKQGRVVIFAAGTGNPFVTTDSAASLRAIEIDADLVLKATNVDGVYSADPRKDKKAKRYSRLTYDEVLSKELGVMDLAAFCQCRDYDLTLRIFTLHKPGALLRIILGEDEGTLIQRSL